MAATWLTRTLDVLFPPRCVGCGRRGVDVCPACVAALRPLGPRVCPRCGAPTPSGAPCARCQRQPPVTRAILAPYPFEGAVRSAILRLKYDGRTRLADFLGSVLVEALQARPLDVDLIVPVPLWPARRRQRGFNQSELLAERVAEVTGWPLEPSALGRARDTLQQTRLAARDRWRNVDSAFTVDPSIDLTGRRILLVDDVCTTGATLEACAAPLVRAGAWGVWAVVAARDLPRRRQA